MSRQLKQKTSIHDDIEQLLPWFVNDTLDEDERQLVTTHVSTCVECRASVELLRRMQAIAQDESPAPMVPTPRSDTLIAAISAKQISKPFDGWWGLALAASLAAVLLVSIMYFQPPETETPNRFETATSEGTTATMSYEFAVQFEPGTTAAERQQVFDAVAEAEVGVQIEPGIYRVTVRLPIFSLDELEKFSEDLESQANVRSVNVLALKLPVR